MTENTLRRGIKGWREGGGWRKGGPGRRFGGGREGVQERRSGGERGRRLALPTPPAPLEPLLTLSLALGNSIKNLCLLSDLHLA